MYIEEKTNRFEIFDNFILFWIVLLSRQNNGSTNALINAFIDSDDEPFYDKVASDEENDGLNNNGQQKRMKLNKKSKKPKDQSMNGVFPTDVIIYLFIKFS